MTNFVFVDNASTTLASPASSSATTMTLASSTNFPSSIPAGYVMALTLNDAATRAIYEIVYVTAISGATLTVVRAQESTVAQNWGVGDFAYGGLTAGALTTFTQNSSAIVGAARNLAGSAAGSTVTAAWTVDELIVETALGGTAYKGVSLSLAFNGAGTGAGGMDTGSVPTSSDLNIYAIYNPATNTWSTLGTVATGTAVYSGTHMPAGYTASALIWAGVTDGSAKIVAFSQKGSAIYIAPVQQATGLSATSYTSVTIASIPSAARRWQGAAAPTGTGTFFIAGNAAGFGEQRLWGVASDPSNGSFGFLPLITAKTAFYFIVNSSGNSWQLFVTGYEI